MANEQTPPNTNDSLEQTKPDRVTQRQQEQQPHSVFGRSTGWPARAWAQTALSQQLTIAPPESGPPTT